MNWQGVWQVSLSLPQTVPPPTERATVLVALYSRTEKKQKESLSSCIVRQSRSRSGSLNICTMEINIFSYPEGAIHQRVWRWPHDDGSCLSHRMATTCASDNTLSEWEDVFIYVCCVNSWCSSACDVFVSDLRTSSILLHVTINACIYFFRVWRLCWVSWAIKWSERRLVIN